MREIVLVSLLRSWRCAVCHLQLHLTASTDYIKLLTMDLLSTNAEIAAQMPFF